MRVPATPDVIQYAVVSGGMLVEVAAIGSRRDCPVRAMWRQQPVQRVLYRMRRVNMKGRSNKQQTWVKVEESMVDRTLDTSSKAAFDGAKMDILSSGTASTPSRFTALTRGASESASNACMHYFIFSISHGCY